MAASGETRQERAVALSELTPHLVCPLCGGYYVDATAIVECLHTFCRSCILRHLETSSYCPALTCDVMIHRTKGAISLRPDATLQSIVYKTVPGLHRDEMQRRQLFYADKPDADAELAPSSKGCYEEGAGRYYAPDDTIDVRIQYASHNPEELVPVRYFRCPAGLPLSTLKKLLFQKYGFSDSLQMELIHGRKVLPADIKLLDVAYIINWSRKSALKLLFRISKPKATTKRKASAPGETSSPVEPPEKKLKSDEQSSILKNDARVNLTPSQDGKTDKQSEITKNNNAKSSDSPVAQSSTTRVSPPSTAVPPSPRVTGQSASTAAKAGERPAKSGERPNTQPRVSPAPASQKTAHQSPAAAVAQSPRAGVLPKMDNSVQKATDSGQKPKTHRPEPSQKTTIVSKGQTNGSNQDVKTNAKIPAVKLNQVAITLGQKIQVPPSSQSNTPGQKPATPRPPGTQLGHSYLACKKAMKLAASAANSKAATVRSVSVGSMTKNEPIDKKVPSANPAPKATNGTLPGTNKTDTSTGASSVTPKPSGVKGVPPSKMETGEASATSKVKPLEKKPSVSKIDCSVQTVPVYRIHSSKQNAVKAGKTNSNVTNTPSSAARKPSSAEDKSAKPPENVSKPAAKPVSQSSGDAKEKAVAKVLVSRPSAGVLDLSTHARETSSVSGISSTKDSKTIFVISGSKRPPCSNKIQSIVESLAQKRMMSSPSSQSQSGSEASASVSQAVSQTSTAVSKAPVVTTSVTFVAPSTVPIRSAAVTPVRPVSSPLHIETASLGLRYGSAVPPLSSLSRPSPSTTTTSSTSSRPVFPVPPLPQRPKSQNVRAIPNPSLLRQRSAEERARDSGKGSPTAGSTAPAMSPPTIRDIHSLTRQLQEAGTSVTITNTS
ncbi:polycomb group protein Psc-like isoform X1 [Amphibalanus amphitrite]|uniref:polycomb group protein Psc-like isoform X1 n=1 Tax=Amphibalanus amphitrite TaxID=1232801 RepID=UPI001C923504|nr:polycomb group protein Psc-like isoform X1 [Amphibalanus amphitrite]